MINKLLSRSTHKNVLDGKYIVKHLSATVFEPCKSKIVASTKFAVCSSKTYIAILIWRILISSGCSVENSAKEKQTKTKLYWFFYLFVTSSLPVCNFVLNTVSSENNCKCFPFPSIVFFFSCSKQPEANTPCCFLDVQEKCSSNRQLNWVICDNKLLVKYFIFWWTSVSVMRKILRVFVWYKRADLIKKPRCDIIPGKSCTVSDFLFHCEKGTEALHSKMSKLTEFVLRHNKVILRTNRNGIDVLNI